MDQLIPRTLRRWESLQSGLARSAIFNQLQTMTKGQLSLKMQADPTLYSFGYGNKVRAALTIDNERFFHRFWSGGERGFGESYVDGDWNSPDLAELIRWFFLNSDQIQAGRPEGDNGPFMQFMLGLRYIQDVMDQVRPITPSPNWASRYELERPFFEQWLDQDLHNSGGIWRKGDTLERAQERKLHRIARELHIKEGSHILELGAGWGGLALFLAENYACRVTAVTVAEEQAETIRRESAKRGLTNVEVLHADYRSVRGRYDRIVSVELVDKITPPLLPEFFRLCDHWLNPQGIMVHQLLLTPDAFRSSPNGGGDWSQKYISQGPATPSLSEVLQAMNQDSGFCIRNLRDIGLSYSKTLAAWNAKFQDARPGLRNIGFDERFIRSWYYYLSYAEAAFDHGLLTAAQITMSRANQRIEERLLEDRPSLAESES